jgi:predicted nucleic acid-binding protein
VALIYLDSSALVKLIVIEPESAALTELLRAWPDRISSALALTEVPRALRRAGFGNPERSRARQVLTRVNLVEVDRRILAAAASLDPPTLRTLDAIHVATALAVREDLGVVVSYDLRLSVAAQRAQLEVLAPA